MITLNNIITGTTVIIIRRQRNGGNKRNAKDGCDCVKTENTYVLPLFVGTHAVDSDTAPRCLSERPHPHALLTLSVSNAWNFTPTGQPEFYVH